jgi:hypothetical protein
MYWYAAAISVSSFLLFQIQPMITKMILPWFGGSAAVWTTAMLFFQMTLLGGYLYAHWSIRTLKAKTQTTVHMVLLCAGFLFLPVIPSLSWKPSGTEEPILRILGLLLMTAGLPYFLLSSTSPLIQAWYARTHKKAMPYKLFALSNAASLAGLLTYPVAIEPLFTLRWQAIGWSLAFAVFCVLCLTVAFKTRGLMPSGECERPTLPFSPTDTDRAPTLGERSLWVLLSACSSTLFLAVTNHMTQNVSPIPFLWVLPLSLYLITFVLAFEFEKLYNRKIFLSFAAISFSCMAYALETWDVNKTIKIVVPVFSLGLFFSCLFFHGELVRRKPAPQYLTSFYLMLSLGGAIGGAVVGLLAPLILPGYFELPIIIVLGSIIVVALIEYRKSPALAVVGWAMLIMVILSIDSHFDSYRHAVKTMGRNFYGSVRVFDYDAGTADERRELTHGSIVHGTQYASEALRHEPTTYYARSAGFGLAERSIRKSSLRIGIIGLGVGTLAAYGREGDLFRFYDINPLIEKLSRSEFTYLADCKGTVEIVLGDGRLSLEQETDQHFDILVVDAFAGDAIPVHLLTREAVALYFRHIKPEGIVALHITNSHLDLKPVVEILARDLGKQLVVVLTPNNPQTKAYLAQWALLSNLPIADRDILAAAQPSSRASNLRVWTDDYSNLFQIIR